MQLLAIDLGKQSFHIHGISNDGEVISRKVTRSKLEAAVQELSPEAIAMEACASAHYWARELRALGHGVELLPAQHVKGYARGQKNDYNDARAIAEACLHGSIRPVVVKTVAQRLATYEVSRLLARHVEVPVGLVVRRLSVLLQTILRNTG